MPSVHLTLSDWRTVYQQSNCDETFAEFNGIVLRTFEKNATLEKKLVSNIKNTTSGKTWLTKEIKQLVAEKHCCFIDYKVKQSAESFVSLKSIANLQIES